MPIGSGGPRGHPRPPPRGLCVQAAKMFWEIAGAHDICPEVPYPVPEFASLAGGDWVHRIPRALAARGSTTPSSAPE